MSPNAPQLHVPIVLAGYSGSGKDTVARGIVDSSGQLGRFKRSSARFTDRDPRPGEVQGVDAHFVSPHAFQEHQGHGDFFYHYGKYGQNFGFSYPVLHDELQHGHSFVIGGEIDTAHPLFLGLRERMKREAPGVKPLMLFVNRALDDILEGIHFRPGSQEEKNKRIAHVRRTWEAKPELFAQMEQKFGPDRVQYIWNDDLEAATHQARGFIFRALLAQSQQRESLRPGTESPIIAALEGLLTTV